MSKLFLTKTVALGMVVAGSYGMISLDDTNSSEQTAKIRIVGGRARFLSSKPDEVIARGGRDTASPYAVNLMAKPAPPQGVPNRLFPGTAGKGQQASGKWYGMFQA